MSKHHGNKKMKVSEGEILKTSFKPTKEFIYSKAPLDKKEAYKETKAKVLEDKPVREQKSFMKKLYEDDDDYDELKVMGGLDEEDEELQEARTSKMESQIKRKAKVAEKTGKKAFTQVSKAVEMQSGRIGKLSLKKGALGLFTVCEIGEDYLIVNHTRNAKGYVDLKGSPFNASSFRLGQFVVAAVTAEIGKADTGAVYNFKDGLAGLNRKSQLTLDLKQVNTQLSINGVTKSMMLQGIVASKESKGFMVDFGFKDGATGFIKSSDGAQLKKGQLVTVIVRTILKKTKVIRCELLGEENAKECVQQHEFNAATNEAGVDQDVETVTVNQMKPGFLVSSKVHKVYENGVEVTFLGGLTGTCFSDHLPEDKVQKHGYKVGTKLLARIISVDPVLKKVAVSLKSHLAENFSMPNKDVTKRLREFTSKNALVVDEAKVTHTIFGGSFFVSVPSVSGQTRCFLHKIHLKSAEEEKAESESESEDEQKDKKKKKPKFDKELSVGQKLEQVKIKEVNYFDGLPIITAKKTLVEAEVINYSSIKPGQFLQATIQSVHADKGYVKMKVSEFVYGFLHLEHMSENPLKTIPPKFQEVGKSLKMRVFNVDVSKRIVEFTKKDPFMKEDAEVFTSVREVKNSDKIIGVVVAKKEHGYVVKSFAGIKGLLTLADIEEKLGKGYDTAPFKVGSIIKAYCLFKKKEKGLALTLSKKKAKANAPAEEGTLLSALPSESQVEAIMKEHADFAKASKQTSLIGHVHQFRVTQFKADSSFAVVKTIQSKKGFVGVVPVSLVDNVKKLSDKDAVFKGIVLDVLHFQIPLVSLQADLVTKKDSIFNAQPTVSEKIELSEGVVYTGVTNGVVGKSGHVSVLFLHGVTKSIKVKDLEKVENYQEDYPAGKIVQVALNKLGRLCTKSAVINKAQGLSGNHTVVLEEGVRVQGVVRSIKQESLYLQVAGQIKGFKSPAKKVFTFGRLHMVECKNKLDFAQFNLGDKVDCKVLHIDADLETGRSFVELTRKDAHMTAKKLDSSSKPISKESDLKIGQTYKGMIVSSSPDKPVAVNLKYSSPLQVQISPFIRGQVPFNHLVEQEEIVKHGSQILQSKKFKIGDVHEVTYLGNSKFSFLGAKPAKRELKKGQLAVVRYVKPVKGRGVTVQIDESTYGFIEMCEITDEVTGNVYKHIAQQQVLVARVVDFDKNGKAQLSARESVVDFQTWRAISSEGTTQQFQAQDEALQEAGNMRNKILKFGASVALNRGDLTIGYVVNIGKAGCFVQIGHNCVVRAGLNELSDSSNFNFNEEVPIGRLVVGRITKVDTQTSGEKRFHFSIRPSLVVYGVGVVDRKKLEVDQEVESIVMAIADGKAFAQIKGSYIKIKVKGEKMKVKVGDHVVSKLKKVTKEKISSEFLKKVGDGTARSDEEKSAEALLKSVSQEAERDLEAIRALNKESEQQPKTDFYFLNQDQMIEQQIQDLNDLQKEEDSDEDMEDVDSEDSDAEAMKQIISKDQEDSEEGEQEMSDEEMAGSGSDEDGSEESDIEDESGESESDEDDATKKLLGKRTLKDRLKEERAIRKKEKEMRSDNEDPKDIADFERLLVADPANSKLWIMYMAFMVDNAGIKSARSVGDRATKAVGMTNEQDKLNIWTAYMNLESNFGTQESLEEVTKRALEVNDRKKIYLSLIDIYKTSLKLQYVEVIYKQLAKKYSNNVDIWASYVEFLIEMKGKEDVDIEFSEPQEILKKSLQALTKDNHVSIISKYGVLEFKHGNPENGRTIFEGIVDNYPKRMDIWSIYMDMEVKFGQDNVTQARHLFERCLSNEHIRKKPKKMRLVFQKYMEYENKLGNKKQVESLTKRVEEYLSQVYDKEEEE